MGRASSAKKVSRAARAGGRSTTKKRSLAGFPAIVGAIVLAGVVLVVYAQSTQESAEASDQAPSSANQDHWHSSYAFQLCGQTLADLSDQGPDELGIHTHDDGLMHVHPFEPAASGPRAQLGVFFDQVGLEVTDDRITLPAQDPYNGRTFAEGETTCGGEPAEIRVAFWADAQAAVAGAEPDEIFTEGFSEIRYTNDLSAYTFFFGPPDEDIPPPPSAAEIRQKAQVDSRPTPGGAGATSGSLPPGQVPGGVDPGQLTVPGGQVPGGQVPGGQSPGATTPPGSAPGSSSATNPAPEGSAPPGSGSDGSRPAAPDGGS